jgi:peptidoglycan/xylan/chitin deacetylase (PgdA/CDA1 family)
VNRRELLRGGGLLAAGAAVSVAGGRLFADDQRAGAGAREFAGGEAQAAASTAEVIWRVPTDRKLIALTLDDGPVPAYTNNYLEMLRDRKVRATFSLVGATALAHRDIVARQIGLGHELENHSYSHRNLAGLSAARADAEVVRGAEVLERLTGRRPRFFRPPRGHLSGATLASVGRTGEDVLMWSLQLHEQTMSVEQNVRHVLDKVTPGTILLAHDARHSRIDRRVGLKALPRIIDGLRDRGYELVTVEELLSARSDRANQVVQASG